jgi:hypothetical protein
MAFDFEKWLNYGKAKVKDAVSSGNKRLDELEAKREADRADKPWLSKDGEDPSIDQVKARIEWQEEQARKQAEIAAAREAETKAKAPDAPVAAPADSPPAPADATPVAPEPADAPPADTPPTTPTPSTPAPRSPEDVAADAATEMARLELEERDRASKARLDEIRRELGVDTPPAP